MKLFITLLLFIGLGISDTFGQTTYTWNVGNGSWVTPANWSPARSAPATTDILVFDNVVCTPTNLPIETIGQLILTNNANVSLTSAAVNRVLTISGGTGIDLDVPSGSTLQLSSSLANRISIAFAGTQDASIAGSLVINANTALNNTYNATNSITIVTGIITNNGGDITSTAADLVFSAGSNYVHQRNGGTIPTATWITGTPNALCNVTGITTAAAGNTLQTFADFTYNCTSQTAANLPLLSAAGTMTVAGNFSLLSTGSGSIVLNPNNNNTRTLDVLNYDQTGGIINLTAAGNGNTVGNIRVTGTLNQGVGTTISNVLTTSASSRIIFGGAGNQTPVFAGTFSPNLSIEINKSNAVDIVTLPALTLRQFTNTQGVFNLGSTINTFIVTDIFTFTNGSIDMSGNADHLLYLRGGLNVYTAGLLIPGNSNQTVYYDADAAQNVLPLTYNHLNIRNLNAGSVTARIKTALTGTIVVNKDLTVEGIGATPTVTLQIASADFSVLGNTFINAYGILNDNATAGTNIFAGSLNLAANSQFLCTNNPPFEFQGGITNNGTFTKSGTGSTTFSTNPQTLSGSIFTFSGGDIIINDPASITLSTNLSFSGTNFTNNSNLASAFNATSGTFTFAPNAVQNINGIGTGTIVFNNLTIAGGSTKTTELPFDVTNDLLISTGTLDLGTITKTIDIGNNLTVTGGLNFGTTTAKTFNLTGNLAGAGTITMTGVGLAHVLNLNGATNTITNFTTTASSGSTINYLRAGDQTAFASTNYQNLNLSGSGNKTFADNNVTVNGYLDVSNSAMLFPTANARTFTVIGNLSGNGTIDMSQGSRTHALTLGGATNSIGTLTTAAVASTITYNRAGDQTIFGSPNYRNLTMSGGGNKSLQANASVNATLTLTLGKILLGASDLTITSINAVGTPTATSYIATDGTGQLKKVFASGVTAVYTLPVGDATNYSPASINFTANSTQRTIGIRVIDAIHPDNDGSTVNISRYWSFTDDQAGVGTYTYTANYTYISPADLTGVHSNLRVNRWNGSAWTQYNTTGASPVITVTGVTETTAPLHNCDFTGRVNSPGTYNWNQTDATANWNTPTNWTPARLSPQPNDILVFENNGITIATNIPTQTIGQLKLLNNSNVSLQSAAAAQTITISGGTLGNDLDIPLGSTLQLSSIGANQIGIAFSNAIRNASVAGTLVVNANAAFSNSYLAANSTTNVSGTITNNGGVITSTALNLLINAGATYNHTMNGGTIPTATWNASSTCNVTGSTSTMAAGYTQNFGNLNINCASQTLALNATLTGVVNIQGDLSIFGTSPTFTISLTVPNVNFTVSGNTTIGAYGILTDNSTTGTNTFVGNFTVAASGSYSPTTNSSNNYFQGNITNNGTINITAGTTYLDKAGVQLLTGAPTTTIFNNIETTAANNPTLNTDINITLNGNFTQNSSNPFTASAGTLSMARNASITGTGTGVVNFNNLTVTANTRTIYRSFNVNGNLTTVGAMTVPAAGTYHLNINLAGNWTNSNAFTLYTTSDTYCDMTIGGTTHSNTNTIIFNNVTFTGNTVTWGGGAGNLAYIRGNLIDNTTSSFTSTANRWDFYLAGATHRIQGTSPAPTTLYGIYAGNNNLSYLVLEHDVICSNNFTVNYAAGGYLSLNGNDLTILGNNTVRNSGVIRGHPNSDLTINGAGNPTSAFYFDVTTSGTTNILNNLTVNRSAGTITLGSPLYVCDVLVSQGILTTALNLYVNCNFTNNASFTQTAGTTFFNGTGTIPVTGTPVLTTFNHVELTNNNPTVNTNINCNVTGNFTQNSSNPFTATTGTVTMSGNAAITGTGAGLINFNNLTVSSGTRTINRSFNVNGNLINNTALTVPAAGTYHLNIDLAGNLTNTSALTLQTTTDTYCDITINGTTHSNTNTVVFNNVTFTGSTVTWGGGALNYVYMRSNFIDNTTTSFTSTGNRWEFYYTGATHRIQGTSPAPTTFFGIYAGNNNVSNQILEHDVICTNNITFSHNAASYFDLNGYDLTINGTHRLAFSGKIRGNANSDLYINGSGNFANPILFDQTTPGTTNVIRNIVNTRTPNNNTLQSSIVILGDFTNTGAFTHAASGTIIFNKAGVQNITGSGGTTSFRDVDLGYFAANNNPTVNCDIDFTINTSNLTQNSSNPFTASAGTVTFNNNAAQPIDGEGAGSVIFNHVTFTGGNTKTINHDIITNGALSVVATNTFSLPTDRLLTINGSLTNAGTFTCNAGSSIVVGDFSGSEANLSLPASVIALTNLTVNRASGVTLNAAQVLSGILTLTSGNIINGANTLTVNNNALTAISGGSASSFVTGQLARAIVTNTGTYNFPVGSVTYNPFALVDPVGTFTLRTRFDETGAPAGTVGTGVYTLDNTKYWETSVTAGALTSTFIRITPNSIPVGYAIPGIAKSTTAGGIFTKVKSTAVGNIITSEIALNSLSFFRLADIIPYVTYFSKTTGDLDDLTTWGDNVDESGNGNNPPDFVTDGQFFIIKNNLTPTIANDWTVGGAESKVTVGDGVAAVNFTVPATHTFNALVDLALNGTLTLQNTTLPTLGSLTNGTVVYDQATALNINTTPVYGNLTISNAGVKSQTGTLNLTTGKILNIASGGTLNCNTNQIVFGGAGGSAVISGTIITSNVNGLNGAANTAIASTNAPVITINAGSTIGYSSTLLQTITARTDYSNVTLSNVGNKTLANNTTIGGNLDISGGPLVLSTRALTLNGTVSNTGTITGDNTASIIIGNYAANLGDLYFTAGARSLATMSLNRPGFTANLATDLQLINSLTLTSGALTSSAILTLGNANTFTVNSTGGVIQLGTNVNYNATTYNVNYNSAATSYTTGRELPPYGAACYTGTTTIANTSAVGGVILSDDVSLNNLTINWLCLFNLNSHTAKICGVYNNNFTITGNTANSTIEFSGTTAKNFTIGTYTGNLLDKLVISNTTNYVTLTNNINVTDLTVNGLFQYDNTNNRIMSVYDEVLINPGATLRAGQGGTTPFQYLNVRGNFTNRGTFDAFLSGFGYLTLNFNGTADATFSCTAPSTTDIFRIQVNKGTDRSLILYFNKDNTTFSVQGGASTLFYETGASNTGTFKWIGNSAYTGGAFNVSNYTINANSAFWIDNPNVTITGQNNSAAVNGLLRLSQGIFNVGTAINNTITVNPGGEIWLENGTINTQDYLYLNGGTLRQNNGTINVGAFADRRLVFNTNGSLIMTGGTINVAGRIRSDANMNLNISGTAVINVPTIGNTTINEESIGLRGAANNITISGGQFNLLNRNTLGTTDYYINGATINITGGTLQIGDAATAANFDFRGSGHFPSIVLDNTNNWKKLILNGTTYVHGDILVNPTDTFDVNTRTLQFSGGNNQTVTNNGTFISSAGRITMNKTANTATLNSPLTFLRASFISGVLNTTGTNLLTILGTATTDVDAGTATSWVSGPLKRTIPNNANGTYTFPVGRSDWKLFEFVNMITTGLGTAEITLEAFDGATGGTAGFGLNTLDANHYWQVTSNWGTVILNKYTDVRLTDAGMVDTKAVGQSNTLTGSYYGRDGIMVGNSLLSVNLIDYTFPVNTTYFALGDAATLCGTYAVGSSQPEIKTLKDVADRLNYYRLTCDCIFELQNDYDGTQPNETFPIEIKQYSSYAGTWNVTIRPDAGVSMRNTIGNPGNGFALISLNDADRITFDGRQDGTGAMAWTITNTNNTTFYSPTIELLNDAIDDTIRYMTLECSSADTMSANIALQGTTGTNGNDNLIVDNSILRGYGAFTPTNVIYSRGTTGALNSGIKITNNRIYDYFNSARNSNGIFVYSNSTAWTITGNRFYQTAQRTFAGNWRNAAVYFNDINSSGINISNNIIGYANETGTGYTDLTGSRGSFTGIYLNTSTASVSNIMSNTVSNILLNTNNTSGDVFTGIIVANGRVDIGAAGTGNTIGTTGAVVTYPIQITKDGWGGRANGISVYSNSTVNMRYNNIGGIETLGDSLLLAGITSSSGWGTLNITNNQIGSQTQSHSFKMGNLGDPNRVYFIGLYVADAGTATIEDNTISNLTSYGRHGESRNRAIYSNGIDNWTYIRRNQIYELRSYNDGGGTTYDSPIVGITQFSQNSWQQISNNHIYNLRVLSAGGDGILGIFYRANNSINTNLVSANNIHSFEAPVDALLGGIEIDNNTAATISNNMIALGIRPDGTDESNSMTIRGIYNTATLGCNFYFNSVYIGGDVPLVSNRSTYAFYKNNTTPDPDNILNNIFVNERTTAGGTGKNYAIVVSAITSVVSDYNIFKSGSGSVLANTEGVDRTDMQQLRFFWPNQNLYSGEILPTEALNPFVNPTGDYLSVDLHLKAQNSAEGMGTNIASITTDFDGQTRNTLTPVDIGADAANTAITNAEDIYSPLISFTDIPNQFILDPDPVVTVTFVDKGPATGGLSLIANQPRLYYRKVVPVGQQAWDLARFAQGTSPTGTSLSSSWTFTIPRASLVPISGNDIIEYYFVAQDMATSRAGGPNVWYSTYNQDLAEHASVSTVTNFPDDLTPLHTFAYYGSLSDTVRIGAGGDYMTLTGAGGLFQVFNTVEVDTSVVAVIINNITEPGTYGLNQWAEEDIADPGYDAPHFLKIVPDGIAPRTLSTAAAVEMIRLNGAQRVVFDGNVGGARQLTIQSSGINYSTFFITNDTKNDTIRNCIIKGNTTNVAKGVMWFGNGTSSGNSKIVLENNLMTKNTTRPRALITAFGNNIPNDSITIKNCEFSNFLNYAIELTNANTGSTGNYWTITDNSFYYTDGVDPGGNQFSIFAQRGSGHNISRNHIGGTAALCGGTPWTHPAGRGFNGIYLSLQTTYPSRIDSNRIENISLLGGNNFRGIYTSTGSYSSVSSNSIGHYSTANSIYSNFNRFEAIEINSSNSAVNVQNNLISNINFNNNSTDYFKAIRFGGTTAATNTISGNIIKDINLSTKTSYYEFYGIDVADGLINMNNNTIGSSTTANSIVIGLNYSPSQQTNYGIRFNSNATGNRISNNTLSNIKLNGTCGIEMISVGSAGDGISNRITNNTINNIDMVAGIRSYFRGVLFSGNGSGNISSNTITNITNPGSVNNILIYLNSNSALADTISNNQISNFTASGDSYTVGVDVANGSNSNPFMIENNSMQNIQLTNSGANTYFRGFRINECVPYLRNNLIDNHTVNGTNVNTYNAIVFDNNRGAFDISNNTITGLSSTGSGIFRGISMPSAAINTLGSIANNIIQNFSINNAAASFDGIYMNAGRANITANTIGHASTANSILLTGGPVNAINIGVGVGSRIDISNNLIANISANSTGATNYIAGISHNSTGGAGGGNISGNQIYNLSTGSTNITFTNGLFSATGILLNNSVSTLASIVQNNIIHDLVSTGNAATLVCGISENYATVTFSANQIWNLRNTSSNAGAAVVGLALQLQNAANNTNNNMIALGQDGENPIYRGIWFRTANAQTKNMYYNTVAIRGNSTGANNSYALIRENVAVPMNIINNNFANQRTGSGTHYAIARVGGTASTLTSNYNNLYAANANNIGYWNASNRTFAQWQTSSVNDANSVTWNANFIDAANGNLRLAPENNCALNGRASIIAITSDFDAPAVREGLPGRPDIGADEFSPNGGNIADTWMGYTNTAWETGSNWACDIVPINTTDVSIPNQINDPIVNGPALAVCHNMAVDNLAVLTVQSGQALTVEGDLALNGSISLEAPQNSGACGSLITLGSVSGTGAGTLKRFIPTLEYHYVSSPVNSANSDMFTKAATSKNPNFYQYMENYDNPTNSILWNDYNGAWDKVGESIAEPLVVGKGYANYFNQYYTYNFTGMFNTGDYNIPVTYTSNDNVPRDGWNLIGNPYPSAIDWDLVPPANKSNIDNVIYFWDQDHITGVQRYVYYGSGTTYGDGSSIPPVVLNSSATPGHIPAAQGFFVHANNNGNVTINNSARVHSTQVFWKDAPIIEYSYLKLKATNSSNENLNDEFMIRFLNDATAEFDSKFDGFKMFSESVGLPQMYSITPEKTNLSINTLPAIKDELVIPLGLNVAEGSYKVDFSDIQLPTGKFAYLEDLTQRTRTEISNGGNYSFEYAGGDVQNRFRIVFAEHEMEETDNLVMDNSVHVWSFGKDIMVNIFSQDAIDARVDILDLNGKIVQVENMNSPYKTIHVNRNTGIYLIRILYNDKFHTQKLILTEW